MAQGLYDDITTEIKSVYPAKALQSMVNEEAPFRKWLGGQLSAGAKAEAGVAKYQMRFSPPNNNGQTADGGAFPTLKNRTEAQASLSPTIFVGGFQAGYKSKAVANSNKGGFSGGVISGSAEEVASNLGYLIESTYTGTHGTGRRATVESDGASSTFVAALPLGTLLLRENQLISVRTTDGGDTVRDSTDARTISSIDHDTRTVTYSSSDQTLVAGDHVHVVVGASQTGLSSLSANGLRGLIDDATFLGTVHGVSRTTYPRAKSNVAGAGGVTRNLSEQILVQAAQKNYRISGKRVTDCWTGQGQAAKYIEFVAADRRNMVASGDNTQNFRTGYSADSLVHVFPGGQFVIRESINIAPREMFLLNKSTFLHYEARAMDWWEGEMLKPTPATTSYSASWQAFMYSIENIGCDMPIGNTVIRDLKDGIAGDA